jgi:hypothetical protein
MNASKENARKAIEMFSDICRRFEIAGGSDRLHIVQFLEAAERKLPREASFAKKPVDHDS